MFSQLKNRKLWGDGISEVEPELLHHFLALGIQPDQLAVTQLTTEVQELNRFLDKPIGLKTEFHPTEYNWTIPDKYKYIDLPTYLIGLVDRVKQDDLFESRIVRLDQEINIFLGRYDDLLKCLIYLVDELKRQGAVWGVGRGSSCSSYILYLIGLHNVDVVLFDIPITDFIRD